MKDPFMARFAENLKGFRKNAGLTQRELGQQIGSCKSTICHYERAERIPDIERASLISQVLDVSLDSFIPDAELEVVIDDDQTSIYDIIDGDMDD